MMTAAFVSFNMHRLRCDKKINFMVLWFKKNKVSRGVKSYFISVEDISTGCRSEDNHNIIKFLRSLWRYNFIFNFLKLTIFIYYWIIWKSFARHNLCHSLSFCSICRWAISAIGCLSANIGRGLQLLILNLKCDILTSLEPLYLSCIESASSINKMLLVALHFREEILLL